jgi:probable rRNA maturation factor
MVIELSDDVPEHQRIPVDSDLLIREAEFLLTALRLHADTELSILLVGPDGMSDLHVEWMGEPGPTDVLSFPMDELTEPAPGETAQPGVLGDVVLCPAVAAEQARAAGHSTADELELLLAHGVLHLLGHDHAEPEEHAAMFAKQAALLEAWRAERDR